MRVFLHVEELLGRGVPVYHVGVEFRVGPLSRRFDYDKRGRGRGAEGATGGRRCVDLGRASRSMREIYAYEQELSALPYCLLLNDCRHYSERLVRVSMGRSPWLTNPLELWRLYNSESA